VDFIEHGDSVSKVANSKVWPTLYLPFLFYTNKTHGGGGDGGGGGYFVVSHHPRMV
jgi:hypothetical protein